VSLTPDQAQELAQAHLDGLASDDDLALLDDHVDDWVEALQVLRERVQDKIGRLADQVSGPERDLVLADFEDERARIDEVLTDLTGSAPADDAPARSDEAADEGVADDAGHGRQRQRDGGRDASKQGGEGQQEHEQEQEPGVVQLQLSWHQGRSSPGPPRTGAPSRRRATVCSSGSRRPGRADAWEPPSA
jgi:hypothetical protein